MSNILPDQNSLRRGGGRPPGSQNKLSRAAKDMIAEVAEKLGGADRMLEWAQKDPDNERAFWVQIYPKLVAITLAGDKKNPVTVIERRIVRATS
jgi:hypothetical protein